MVAEQCKLEAPIKVCMSHTEGAGWKVKYPPGDKT